MNLLAKISSYFPSLTKSEKKVAQFVLANPDEIESISIQQLAKKAKVGESTIIRFVKKVGFEGYQEFKLGIVKNQLNEIKLNIEEDESLAGFIHQQLLTSLNETRQFLKEKEAELKRVAKKMVEADCIYVFAAGNSGTVADDLANRLVRIGKKAVFHADSHVQAINASVMTKNDLAFAISVSGNTEDILLNLQLVKESGASIVALTNYMKSGITKLTDDVLICSSREFSSLYGSNSSKITQLYALDVLFHEIVDLDRERIQLLRDQTNNALIDRLK